MTLPADPSPLPFVRKPLWALPPHIMAELAALLVVIVFALVIGAPILAGGVPLAADTLYRGGTLQASPVHNSTVADSALQFWPWQVFIRQSLAGGEWPLWDPHLFAGYPFLGSQENQLYYPLAWVGWLLPLAASFQVNILLHLVLAGTGMYTLARVLGASRCGSVLAGLIFGGSGQLYTMLDLMGNADIYVWLPWVVTAAELTWRRCSPAWTAVTVGLYGVLAVAGHLSWLLYSSAFLVCWLGGRAGLMLIDHWRGHHTAPGSCRCRGQLIRVVAMLAGGPLLAAVHLLPVLELITQSSRVTAGALPTATSPETHIFILTSRIIALLVPQFFGTAVGGIGRPLVFNDCWYVGLAPLVLATLALGLRRERRVWALGTIGLGALGIALGLPGLNLLHHLPGLQTEIPERTAYLFIFCVAALSALGFDRLLTYARKHPAAAVVLPAVLILPMVLPVRQMLDWHAATADQPALYQLQTSALGQAGLTAGASAIWFLAVGMLRGSSTPRRRAVLAGGIIGLLFVDMLTYAPDYNTYVAPAELTVQSGAANAIHQNPEMGRIIAVDNPLPLFVPNSATLFGLSDVQGYDSFHLTRYQDFWYPHGAPDAGYFNVIFRPQLYNSAQANLLNVRYIVSSSLLDSGREAQENAPVRTAELSTGPVIQTFRTPARLAMLTIAVDTVDRINHSPVTLHVRRTLTDTTDLAVQTLSPAKWRGQPWIKFRFAPLPVQAGDQLVMVIESPPVPGDTVALRRSAGDVYPAGELYRGGLARAS
ncbi:MAG TPA: hypothetical protein VM536_18335, partial [Chloroflexia bacterium]|nr:hypothetical protein [Chloroflexia bacterium]